MRLLREVWRWLWTYRHEPAPTAPLPWFSPPCQHHTYAGASSLTAAERDALWANAAPRVRPGSDR